jgi:hypothetical protein
MEDKPNKSVKGIVINKETGNIDTEIFEGDSIIRGGSKKAIRDIRKKKDTKKLECLVWNMSNFMKMNTMEMRLWMNDLSQAEKAFLFSIVPYVSYNDCHLETHDGKDIGTEDLTSIVKMSRALTYSTIDSLISKDIIYRGKNSKSRQYFVNPWLFYKGDMINKVLQTMFKHYKIRVLGNKRWMDVKHDKADKKEQV